MIKRDFLSGILHLFLLFRIIVFAALISVIIHQWRGALRTEEILAKGARGTGHITDRQRPGFFLHPQNVEVSFWYIDGIQMRQVRQFISSRTKIYPKYSTPNVPGIPNAVVLDRARGVSSTILAIYGLIIASAIGYGLFFRSP